MTFGSLEQVLDFAVDREREARELYLHYSRLTASQSFRTLLVAMADMEKEHEGRLTELKGRRVWASALASPLPERFGLEGSVEPVRVSPGMERGDFLLLVIRKESEAQQLYQRMEGLATFAEARRLFRHLAGEEQKHRDWAQEAYDRDQRPEQ